MDFAHDFPAAQQQVSAALVGSTRAASRVSAEDVAFYRSLDPSLGATLDRQAKRLRSLTEKLIARTATALDLEPVKLPDEDAIDSSWKRVVDVIDGLLERADTCLDEFTGLVKRSAAAPQANGTQPKNRPQRFNAAFRSQEMPKPQLNFDQQRTNFPSGPFKPVLTKKPHAIIPLKESLEITLNSDGNQQYVHPYQHEIGQYKYPSRLYTTRDPVPYEPFDTTEATFVDNFEGVLSMLDELKKADEIAVDLEHHDTHSYVGIVSLMQISTRAHDWIVDTLKPWRHKLEILNEVFADPAIVKVLHGSHMDVIWLQRDFGVYINGLFDTYDACRALGYPAASLAFLLKKFVDFDAQKQYQMADWRIRPLPAEMFTYARSDTHFLLYIFDHLRNELIEKSDFKNNARDFILSVANRSKETALQRYEYHVYDESNGLGKGGWLGLIQKTPALLSKEQFAAFRKIHQWRDQVARSEDEGIHHIMPNHLIFNIAQKLPSNLSQLSSMLHSAGAGVEKRKDELLDLIREAKVNASNGPDMMEVLSSATNRHHSHRKQPVADHSSQEVGQNTLGSTDRADGSHFRSSVSQFWGSAGASRHNTDPGQDEDFNRILLLPGLQLDESRGGGDEHETKMQDLTADELSNEDKRALNDMPTSSSKRKLDAFTKDPSTFQDLQDVKDAKGIIPANGSQDQEQSRAQRKAAKFQRKSKTQSAAETVPFDYGTATSVWHGDLNKSGQRPAKSFDGFARAADTGTGLPRLQGSKGGRSSTIK